MMMDVSLSMLMSDLDEHDEEQLEIHAKHIDWE